MAENGIKIELTKAQVQQVVREAGGVGFGRLLEGVTVPEITDDLRFSRSLLRGLAVLQFFSDGEWKNVTAVAREIGAGTSTTYRYVATLTEVGALEQDSTSRRYRLVR